MAVEEVDKNTYKKYRSRRYLFCVWAALMDTVIIVYTMLSNNDHLVTLGITLAGIVAGFTTLETVRKWKKEEEEIDE